MCLFTGELSILSVYCEGYKVLLQAMRYLSYCPLSSWILYERIDTVRNCLTNITKYLPYWCIGCMSGDREKCSLKLWICVIWRPNDVIYIWGVLQSCFGRRAGADRCDWDVRSLRERASMPVKFTGSILEAEVLRIHLSRKLRIWTVLSRSRKYLCYPA